MSSTNFGKKLLIIAGKILLLLLVVIGVLQSGAPAGYVDPYGFLFILVGGVALVLISFSGAEIWRAFRHASGGSGNDEERRHSAHFWEAAGRGFWILGGLSGVLSMILGFMGLRTTETASISSLIPILIRPLLSTFYGCLLAVICFVPCWKLLGMLPSRPLAPNPEHSEPQLSSGRSGWRFMAVFGFVLFFAALVWSARAVLNLSEIWPIYRSPLLVVLGGALVLMLFMGGNNQRLTSSAAFAGMGLIGSLMGFIQMLIGMTNPMPSGIAQVAGAIAFILFSCFTALLGMAIIGAPLEDRAISSERFRSPSAFSRVSWYVFPVLSLIFVVVVFINLFIPMPNPH